MRSFFHPNNPHIYALNTIDGSGGDIYIDTSADKKLEYG